MNSLNKVKEQIESLKKKNVEEVIKLKDSASILFSKLMKPNEKIIERMGNALDNSKDLTSVDHDEYYYRWVKVDFSKLIDESDEFQKELLKDYLSDNHCINADFENDCITTSEGPCILINHHGEVFDQDRGKWFIKKNDYETVEERNKLIENYMEKKGYFPSVISVDYHGNAVYLNTLVKK